LRLTRKKSRTRRPAVDNQGIIVTTTTDHAALKWTLSLLLAAAVAGCVHPQGPKVVSDPDPSVKIPAAAVAVQNRDLSVIPQLIADLQSDDSAVRLYAIEALHRLTGHNLGYRYYDSDEERAAAVQRWRDWQKHRSDNSAAEPPAK
jgi:hypothetical protein